MQVWIKRRADVPDLPAGIPKNARHRPVSGCDRLEARPHAGAACGTEQSLARRVHAGWTPDYLPDGDNGTSWPRRLDRPRERAERLKPKRPRAFSRQATEQTLLVRHRRAQRGTGDGEKGMKTGTAKRRTESRTWEGAHKPPDGGNRPGAVGENWGLSERRPALPRADSPRRRGRP